MWLSASFYFRVPCFSSTIRWLQVRLAIPVQKKSRDYLRKASIYKVTDLCKGRSSSNPRLTPSSAINAISRIKWQITSTQYWWQTPPWSKTGFTFYFCAWFTYSLIYSWTLSALINARNRTVCFCVVPIASESSKGVSVWWGAAQCVASQTLGRHQMGVGPVIWARETDSNYTDQYWAQLHRLFPSGAHCQQKYMLSL